MCLFTHTARGENAGHENTLIGNFIGAGAEKSVIVSAPAPQHWLASKVSICITLHFNLE